MYGVIQRSVVTASGLPLHPFDLGSNPSLQLDLQSSAFVKEQVASKPAAHFSHEDGACSPSCDASVPLACVLTPAL